MAGNREAQPTDDHRVDADDPPACVGERTTGIARIETDVGLDHFGLQPAPASWAFPRRDRLGVLGGLLQIDGGTRGDDARGQRALAAKRIAERDHQLADPQAG